MEARVGRERILFFSRLSGNRFRATEGVFWLPLLLTKEGGEGRGEEALLNKSRFKGSPSLRLSPRSFLTGREREQHATGVACRPKNEMRPAHLPSLLQPSSFSCLPLRHCKTPP